MENQVSGGLASTTGLRQRRTTEHRLNMNHDNGNDQVLRPQNAPDVARDAPTSQQQDEPDRSALVEQQPSSRHTAIPPGNASSSFSSWRTSHVYCFVSAIMAILAVITSSSSPLAGTTKTATGTSTAATPPTGGGGRLGGWLESTVGSTADLSKSTHQHALSTEPSGGDDSSSEGLSSPHHTSSSMNKGGNSAGSGTANTPSTSPYYTSSFWWSSSRNTGGSLQSLSSSSWDALDSEWWRSAVDTLSQSHWTRWFLDHPLAASAELEQQQQQTQGKKSLLAKSSSASSSLHQQQSHEQQPWWAKLAFFNGDGHQQSQLTNHPRDDGSPNKHSPSQSPSADASTVTGRSSALRASLSWWKSWLDPSLLMGDPSMVTGLIDKVLTSTPRLLAIANLLLALTYLMHTAVADWFLGAGVYPPPGEWAMTGRERLGSFLVFKLLLISAVVSPDTLDLLILLSWYTLLSFLRSLAHLAAATTSHTTQSGQPPRSGVLQLLLVVLLCDFVAAAVCVALFQLAGVGMVILLTCDCALLAVEVMGHILKHVRQVLEEMHEHQVTDMEEAQLRLHARLRRLQQQEQQRQLAPALVSGAQERNMGVGTSSISEPREQAETVSRAENHAQGGDPTEGREGWDLLDDESLGESGSDADDDGIRTLPRNNQHRLIEDSRRLDQSMDALELAHARRLAILDTTIFCLQLSVHGLTVAHFLHIWTLHGIQFTLIDGVLALHLHSALSAASKQIAERRNLHRIARNLDGMFPNATELDLKVAHASGDVCCICLGAMSVGSVKKVGCGHLYHTNCLREVIERAHSMEAAKCPLCRASVVDGSRPGTNGDVNGAGNDAAGEPTANAGNNAEDNAARLGLPNDGMNHRGERALFRFSTEGILPTWMPLPAFSFEVVRRPTQRPENSANNSTTGGRGRNGANPTHDGRVQDVPQQVSLVQRLLRLAGAVPLSPEEEARALGQLVDMFPQYDRADLLRELRDRGSAESVVEAVLLGVFTGRVRGSAGAEATPTRANNAPAFGQEDGQGEDRTDRGADDASPERLAVIHLPVS